MARQPQQPDPRVQNPAEPTGQNPKPTESDAGNTVGRNDPLQASGTAPSAAGPNAGVTQPGNTAGGSVQAGPLSGPAQTAPAQGPGATQAPNAAASGSGQSKGIEILPTDVNDTGSQKFPGMDGTDEPGKVGATLMDVVSHFRDATNAMRNKQWGNLSRACGNLLNDFGDIIDGNLSFMPTMKGGNADSAPSQAEINNVRSQFDQAVQEFERERVNAVAIVPSVSQTGWHQAGGSASGMALPRATPRMQQPAAGMVGAPIMQPNWLALLLEIAPVVIDAIRRAINPQQ